MKLIPDCDYFVRTVPLPYGVRGMVTPNDDTTYSIYLNARYPEAWQLISYIHEVRHILADDFYNGDNIAAIEKRASNF